MTQEVKIERGIPIPPDIRSGITAAFSKMEIGDSILLPKKRRGNLHVYAQRAGIRIKVHSIDEDHLRVWKTGDRSPAGFQREQAENVTLSAERV